MTGGSGAAASPPPDQYTVRSHYSLSFLQLPLAPTLPSCSVPRISGSTHSPPHTPSPAESSEPSQSQRHTQPTETVEFFFFFFCIVSSRAHVGVFICAVSCFLPLAYTGIFFFLLRLLDRAFMKRNVFYTCVNDRLYKIL